MIKAILIDEAGNRQTLGLPPDPEHQIGLVGDYFIPCPDCNRIVLAAEIDDVCHFCHQADRERVRHEREEQYDRTTKQILFPQEQK